MLTIDRLDVCPRGGRPWAALAVGGPGQLGCGRTLIVGLASIEAGLIFFPHPPPWGLSLTCFAHVGACAYGESPMDSDGPWVLGKEKEHL